MNSKLLSIALVIYVSAFLACSGGGSGDDGGTPVPAIYTVIFDSQGGSDVDPQTVNEGELLVEPEDPAKTENVFGGWFKEAICVNAWNFDTDTVSADITLYAKWTINRYSVTYEGNGNTGGTAPSPSEHDWNSIVTVADNSGNLVYTPAAGTAEAFKFGGWNTQVDGNGITYEAGTGTFTITEDIILYAKWVEYELRDVGPAGGWIFYDKGSFSDGWRYMEAAPSDSPNHLQWQDPRGTLIGCTETVIGSGKANTTLLAAWLRGNGQPTDRAGIYCDELSVNGYSDWFLPSKDELSEIYTNLYSQGVGGLSAYPYWSSSEVDADLTWTYSFNTNSWATGWKIVSIKTRPARCF